MVMEDNKEGIREDFSGTGVSVIVGGAEPRSRPWLDRSRSDGGEVENTWLTAVYQYMPATTQLNEEKILPNIF